MTDERNNSTHAERMAALHEPRGEGWMNASLHEGHQRAADGDPDPYMPTLIEFIGRIVNEIRELRISMDGTVTIDGATAELVSEVADALFAQQVEQTATELVRAKYPHGGVRDGGRSSSGPDDG